MEQNPATVYDIAIIGAGPAGMTAAIYSARANMNVLLLDKLAPGGQIVNTFVIQNYPGMGSINGAELAIKMYEHTMELGVTFDYGTVTVIQEKNQLKEIFCEEGNRYTAKAVIIAVGTEHRMLDVPHEADFAGTQISWCAICDGAHYQGKEVLVVGGGNSAVEEAIYLAEMAKRVKLITLFSLTADSIACDKLRSMENVEIYEFYDILEFLPGNRFTGLRAKSTRTEEEIVLQADGCFEYIGLKPSAGAFHDLGIVDAHGYIEADNDMKTAMPGIFAAGDVTSKMLRQVVTACGDGAVASQSAVKYVRSLTE